MVTERQCSRSRRRAGRTIGIAAVAHAMTREPGVAKLRDEQAMATSDGIRLHALDGGRVSATGSDAAEMADDGAYEGQTLEMPVPCFLIRHPAGDLMWDTGMSQTRTDLGE